MQSLSFRLLIAFSCAVLTIAALPKGVVAADLDVSSRIESVTVFPTGAEIERGFAVDLEKGEHVLKVLLPHSIHKSSIQIEVTSPTVVLINSLDLRTAPNPVTTEEDAHKEALREKIKALEVDIAGHLKVVENAALARELVETLARRQLQPHGTETAPAIPKPSELAVLLDMVDTRLSQISQTSLAAKAQISETRQKIDEHKAEIAKTPIPETPRMQLSIYVEAAQAGQASFLLRYQSSSASWQPVYEARLSTEGDQPAQVELVRKASVAQVTTEDWGDVRLTISTARRTSRITPPALAPQALSQFVSEVEKTRRENSSRRNTALFTEESTTSQGNVKQMQASALATGFNVVFDIPGRVSIDSSGNSRTVRIGAGTVTADLSLAASPKTDLTAYLIAEFAVASEAPLLPGRVMLFRDSVFIGETDLPLSIQGDMLELGFGADDLVTIERREVSSQSGETGLVSTAYVEERSYLTRITNGHGFPIPITIEDQSPTTSDERIRVELLPRFARPDSEDLDGRSGVYSWTRTLKPNTTTEIGFGFRVMWPKGISR